MKFVCALVLFAMVAAEPPRYRQSRFRVEQREDTTESEREPTTQNNEAPYPAAGFIPPRDFGLPTRQEIPPATSYGVPATSYGSPLLTYTQTEYGVPKKSKGDDNEENDEGRDNENKEGHRNEDEDEREAEDLEEGGRKKESSQRKEGKKNKNHEIVNTGAYYILLPDSQLQRVLFRTENDVTNMAYTARLQYRNEDRAPVFVYSAVPVPAAPQQQLSQYPQFPSSAYVQY